jgi:hypothetical protein
VRGADASGADSCSKANTEEERRRKKLTIKRRSFFIKNELNNRLLYEYTRECILLSNIKKFRKNSPFRMSLLVFYISVKIILLGASSLQVFASWQRHMLMFEASLHALEMMRGLL